MSNPIRPTRRHSLFRGLSLAALALSGGLYGLVTEAGAQEPPPLIRSTTSAARALTDSPRQHDLMQVLLEFAPGAATASHRVNGRGIFTVVSGEITRIEEGGDTKVFKAGETFPEDDSDHFDVDANRGSVPARLLATFLLQPGAEPLIVDTNAPPPSKEPTFVAVARTTVGTIPAAFTLSHTIGEVSPGFAVALHTHDGWHMLTTLSGQATNRVNGVVQTGQTFVHGPHDVHEAANTSNAISTYMSASINPQGAVPLRFVSSGRITPAPAAPSVRPPATGDGGLK